MPTLVKGVMKTWQTKTRHRVIHYKTMTILIADNNQISADSEDNLLKQYGLFVT